MSKKRRIVSEPNDVRWERRRWSCEQKDELVERWCESGLSRAEFCRREGLCYGRFLAWVAEASMAGGGPEFVEVLESEGAPGGGSDRLEVVAPNGWKVCLGEGFDSRAVERLLGIVARC